jgi:hypothetical protein
MWEGLYYWSLSSIIKGCTTVSQKVPCLTLLFGKFNIFFKFSCLFLNSSIRNANVSQIPT